MRGAGFVGASFSAHETKPVVAPVLPVPREA